MFFLKKNSPQLLVLGRHEDPPVQLLFRKVRLRVPADEGVGERDVPAEVLLLLLRVDGEAGLSQRDGAQAVVALNAQEGVVHLGEPVTRREKKSRSPNVGLEPTTLRLRVSCSTD